MSSPLVSVIIVNWNGKSFLGDCLDSLSKILYKHTEILLVDNASTDGSVEYIEKNYPTIRIIQNKENVGFARGNEIGYKEAKGMMILILNPDTIVDKDFLQELIKILSKRKDIGAVQPKVLMYPQKNLIDSIGSFLLANGDLYHFGREKDHTLSPYNKEMEIFSAKGVCILFKREVLEKTGFFDQDFFVYFEETDLCMRIWLAGYKILYAPKAIIYHKGGESSKQKNVSFILFHSYKNGICTFVKNLSISYLLRVLPIMILLYQGVFFMHMLKGELSNALAVQRAILWNIVHIRKTLQKRQYVQRNIRKIEDTDYLPKLIKKVKLSYYYYQFFGGMDKYKDEES